VSGISRKVRRHWASVAAESTNVVGTTRKNRLAACKKRLGEFMRKVRVDVVREEQETGLGSTSPERIEDHSNNT